MAEVIFFSGGITVVLGVFKSSNAAEVPTLFVDD